jgi:hypothetical protein
MYSSYTIFCLFCFMDVSLFISYFSLWHISSESELFFRFADGAIQHTWRLASVAWVDFTPESQLLSSEGICLGDATNNVVEYNTVI